MISYNNSKKKTRQGLTEGAIQNRKEYKRKIWIGLRAMSRGGFLKDDAMSQGDERFA